MSSGPTYRAVMPGSRTKEQLKGSAERNVFHTKSPTDSLQVNRSRIGPKSDKPLKG